MNTPLIFEERPDGFRVSRGDSMIASMRTKRVDSVKSATGPLNPFGVQFYCQIPFGECQIHSAGGPLAIQDIGEMLEHLASVIEKSE